MRGRRGHTKEGKEHIKHYMGFGTGMHTVKPRNIVF